nr:sensor histidine kinase [Lachnospiraceae bacterium]
EEAVFSLKNISRQQLNIDASQLTERFIRGDVSRSGEGSGLGLSIAQNLTELMKGKFEVYLDGDLFKVTVSFECIKCYDEAKDGAAKAESADSE